MNLFENTLNIQTLGRFSTSISGKVVIAEWPDEKLKELFCSILSPLDLYITWDRLSRSIWEVQATETCREQLEDIFLKPLNSFLIKEIGFTPLIADAEGIKIDHKLIQLDAFDFNGAVLEGLKQLSLGKEQAAFQQFIMAKSLYSGSYLPGMLGKIIANTRKELESIYQITINKEKNNELSSRLNLRTEKAITKSKLV